MKSLMRRPPLTPELIHLEIVKLLALVAIAVTGFVGTRACAAVSGNTGLRDAERWYAVGQQRFDEGQVEAAIDAFRRATLENRANRSYGLALARAQTRAGQREAAERTLLALRERAPEDPDINLELARAAAASDRVAAAVRYYHNALYGLWPTAAGPDRVRLELIQFLLRRGERRLALAELLAASTDATMDVDENVRFGGLFLEAGEPRRARDHFERALRASPHNTEALAGAGIAAFRLGDYANASRYLRTVPDDAREARETREAANLVIANDPLESRIGAAERQRRLVGGLARLRRRLEVCPAEVADAQRPAIDAFEQRLTPRGRSDRDTIEDGVDLVYRVERALAACGGSSSLDRAWLLIGERHGAAS